MNATISKDEIAVTHSVRDGVNYLTVDVPNGWDDVKKLTKKVLRYNGMAFMFTGWNSDSLRCYFIQSSNFAKVSSR